MYYVKFESIESDGNNTLYNLYFDDELVKTGLTLDEVMQEISKKEEEKNG